MSSSRTPNQDKALQWYIEKNNYKPHLSTHPIYYFTNSDGETVKEHIDVIYQSWNKQRKVKETA